MKEIPLNERIIFALDVESVQLAEAWVERLESHIRFYKVGLQLFLAGWFNIVEWIAKRNNKVMLDLKFFDVPETVKLAVRQLRDRGVTFATVHGNDPIVRAAVEAKGEVKVLAITVLTSFGQEDMEETLGGPGEHRGPGHHQGKESSRPGMRWRGLLRTGSEAFAGEARRPFPGGDSGHPAGDQPGNESRRSETHRHRRKSRGKRRRLYRRGKTHQHRHRPDNRG